jgi:hypothetical protein
VQHEFFSVICNGLEERGAHLILAKQNQLDRPGEYPFLLAGASGPPVDKREDRAVHKNTPNIDLHLPNKHREAPKKK